MSFAIRASRALWPSVHTRIPCIRSGIRRLSDTLLIGGTLDPLAAALQIVRTADLGADDIVLAVVAYVAVLAYPGNPRASLHRPVAPRATALRVGVILGAESVYVSRIVPMRTVS